jgi:toxin FitB
VKFLLDTCLISELVRKVPNAAVLKWSDARDEQSLFLSVFTLGEIQKGICRLSTGPRKDDLQAWIEHDLIERFAGRILDLDLKMALIWGKLLGEAELKGVKLPVMDSLIAATAIAHGLVVVTRNVKNIERCLAKVFNPWVG